MVASCNGMMVHSNTMLKALEVAKKSFIEML